MVLADGCSQISTIKAWAKERTMRLQRRDTPPTQCRPCGFPEIHDASPARSFVFINLFI